MRNLTPIVFASDLPECECCEEPWCELHGMHYADCDCIGPAQIGDHKTVEVDGYQPEE